VQYLHSHNVIHRDLKPENLLLSASNDIKICDFGWCTLGSETSVAFGGTLDYMAPEIVAGTTHSFAVDIWALGVLLFELVHGRAPFSAVKKSEKCKQILSLSYTCDSKLSPSLQNLIQSLLRAVPQHRLSIADIITHPWLQEGPTDSSLSAEELKENMPDSALQRAENGELLDIPSLPASTLIHKAETLNAKLEDLLPTPSLEALLNSPASAPLPRSRSLHAASPRSKSVIHSPTIQSTRQARLDALLLEAKQLPAESVHKPGLIGWVGSFFSCTNR
jgi:serine/threonine protein kinase